MGLELSALTLSPLTFCWPSSPCSWTDQIHTLTLTEVITLCTANFCFGFVFTSAISVRMIFMFRYRSMCAGSRCRHFGCPNTNCFCWGMERGPGTKRTASAAGWTRSWARMGWRRPRTVAGSWRNRATSSTWCSPPYWAALSKPPGWCSRLWARSGYLSSSPGDWMSDTMAPWLAWTVQRWLCSTERKRWSCGEGASTILRLRSRNLILTSWKSTTTAGTPLVTCRRRAFPEQRAWRRCWTGCCHTGTALWCQR